ncbi:protein LLP homolog [Temnothorax curvispinosus]|uniref:Protein LLP homolog n=1 Tax=Temnothorax curvispinosus TaxID=300111 RepID=A0A6J1RBY2_9HYME|nr:protein LLP homolog [Temnothorax curvispinosus]XP_024891768.1 protein LLP homolog [Temnothorax curvispinosus]
MAKSLRSKWKRKCRAIKRERYAVKELDRLKKTLGIDANSSKDVEMADISEIATVVNAEKVKEDVKAKRVKDVEPQTETGEEQMEVEGARVYNKKTLRDQYGNYPAWMSHRKIMKHKKGRAKTKKATKKPGKRLTRRQKKAKEEK